MLNSFLFCIGLEKFLDKKISKLLYSRADCYRIQRACNILNLAVNATLILNEEATTKNILNLLSKPKLDIKYLYIYISSHGDTINNESYIFTHDTISSNVSNSALSLSHLLELLANLPYEKIYLVIDACKIKFKGNINNKIVVYFPKKDISFEDTFFQQSLYTKIFIRYLSKFTKNINKNRSIRYQRIRKDLFLCSQRRNFICIYGSTALGKSYFLKQIEQYEKNTYLISIPKLVDITYNIVLTLISEKISLSINNKFYNSIEADPERYIRFYAYNEPESLLIIDHFDHLNKINADKLVKFLEELPMSKIVCSRSYPVNFKGILYSFPNLSKVDISEFISNFSLINKSDLKIILSNCKNYIDLLNSIHDYQNRVILNANLNELEIKKIKKALIISGGFINHNLFAKTFNLTQKIIFQLIDKGLLIKNENICYPHDVIYEEKISAKDLVLLKRKAQLYWKKEILLSSFSCAQAIHSYILLLESFNFKFSLRDVKFYENIILKLKGKQNTYYLIILYEYFLKNTLPIVIIKLMAEALVDIGKFNEASKLIVSSNIKNKSLSELSVELLWWQGQFEKCVETANYLHPYTSTNLLCSRGIGYFFLGLWRESALDLKTVINNNSENKQKYFAYCVLATIQGIRGNDLFSSKENFIEAIRLAKMNGKLSWLAIVYGNVGEILWKAAFIEKSLEILVIAKQLAYLTDNDALSLEINRNLLHAFYKNKQFSQAFEHQEFLQNSYKFESYGQMQIINSLITHNIFFKNNFYTSLISEAIALTKNNHEYYIYTLSNLALIKFINFKKKKLAVNTMIQALELCKKGKNWLAMKQCLDDWDSMLEIYEFNYPSTQITFRKWHQMLQKELLPHLHHLADLSEFLQRH